MSLPQADASTLVDREELERRVQDMYREVALDPHAPRHFETGRSLALRLGYPEPLLDAIPYTALASFAGVGYHLDLAGLEPGDRVLDLGSGSGTDAFCAGLAVGDAGRVVGVDFTDAQIASASPRRSAPPHPQRPLRRGEHRRPPLSPTAPSTSSSRTASSTSRR